MALLGLLAALLAFIGSKVHASNGNVTRPIASCLTGLSGGFETALLPEADTLCALESLERCQGQNLTGNILLTGSTIKQIWDLGVGADGPLSFAPDANVTASCFSVLLQNPVYEEHQLRPLDIETLLAPPFLQSGTNAVSKLTMRDVTIWLGCDHLLEWQQHLCAVRLPGLTKVQGNNVSIISWRTKNVFLERVNLTCEYRDDFLPACSMATVDVVDDIQGALNDLQVPSLPLVLTLTRGLDFTDSHWPADGLRITANVTLSATLDSVVTVSFGLKTVLFAVDTKNFMTAFLSFRGCILVDLPLSYLPLTHPRRPFGILSTGLWPVYREEVAMGLYNCTLILTDEEFKFWSFWLTILISPIPSTRALGNWSYANGVELEPSGDDFINLVSYMGRYTTLINVRYQVANGLYKTQQRNNILQITGDAQVPPTVVFQVRDSSDLLSALVEESNSAAAQYGQYIILTENVTMSDHAHWLNDKAAIRYTTTITTWPSARVIFDLQLWTNVIETLSALEVKDMVLMNLGPGARGDDVQSLVTGLWAFNISNWRNADQQRIALQNVAMVVPQQEVDYYWAAAAAQDQRAGSWISSFQVGARDEVNQTWVYFSTLATTRFTGQNVNITSTVPDMFDHVPLPISDFPVSGAKSGSGGSSGGTDRGEVLLFALLAITLPTAVAVALLTYLVIKRRRLSRICKGDAGAADEKHSQHSGDDDEADEEGGKQPAAPIKQDTFCCMLLPLSLRKSKFVNPLYDDADGPAAEVVLTAVLGPSTRGARALVPELPTVFGTEVSTTTLCSTDDIPDARAAAAAAAGLGVEDLEVRLGTRSSTVAPVTPAELELRLAGSGEAAAAGGAAGGEGGRAFGAAPEDGAAEEHGRCSSSRAAGVGTVEGWLATAGAAYGQAGETRHAGCVAQPSGQQAEAAATSRIALRAAGTPSTTSVEEGRDPSREEQHRLALAARQQSGRQASQSQSAAGANPQLIDMQQMDRLRREIGDRHLEVQHSLGWGGCGVVYKGIWKGLQVAVKTVLVQGDSKPSWQFLTEAAISASLQHANIVTTYVYELRPLDEVDPGMSGVEIRVQSRGSDDSPAHGMDRMSCWKLYIVQEYCELGTLKAAIDQGYFKGTRGGMPNLAFLLAIALDVAWGLMHVHSKNVVHGDVTVSNVLLQTCPARPQGCIAKVADFGLSVKFEAGQSSGSHIYGGTPHYMAPERARGVLSKQSDIYSLGVCLWELYCGTPPWRRNAAGAHHQHLEGSNSSVDSGSILPYDGEAAVGGSSDSFPIPRSCPAAYSSLVLSCLSAEPQRRPTATAVTEALQRLHRRYG